MSERVPSDHPSITTYGAKLERSGGTRRPCLRVPPEVDVDDGEGDGETVVRLVLAGTTYHAPVTADAKGAVVRGAYDNARLARERSGENRLLEWADDVGRGAGDAVELDEIEAGHQYGLRVPGTRTVYSVTERPDASLAAIAERLDGDDG